MSPLDPSQRDLVKCEDMRIHAGRAREFLAERSLDQFLEDRMVQDAVIRCVEVVGEAARLVSEQTRKRAPQIPWTLIIGMRNVLAHEYGTVDLEKVYSVVTDDMAELLRQIRPLIAELEQEVGWHDDEGR